MYKYSQHLSVLLFVGVPVGGFLCLLTVTLTVLAFLSSAGL